MALSRHPLDLHFGIFSGPNAPGPDTRPCGCVWASSEKEALDNLEDAWDRVRLWDSKGCDTCGILSAEPPAFVLGEKVAGHPRGLYPGLSENCPAGGVWFVEETAPGEVTLVRAVYLKDGTRHAEFGTYAHRDLKRIGRPEADSEIVVWLVAEIRRLQKLLPSGRES